VSAKGQNFAKIFLNKIGTQDDELLTGLDRLLSPEKVAKFLDVSKRFVYELIAKKEIDAQPVGTRLKRIRLSAIEAWLLRSKNGVTHV